MNCHEVLHRLKLVTGVDISTRPVRRLGREGKAKKSKSLRAVAEMNRMAFRRSITMFEHVKCTLPIINLDLRAEVAWHTPRLWRVTAPPADWHISVCTKLANVLARKITQIETFPLTLTLMISKLPRPYSKCAHYFRSSPATKLVSRIDH